MPPYTNKTAIIIGGSHGIGLATAKALLSNGAKVLVTGRRLEPVEAARAELSEYTSSSADAALVVVQSDITARAAHEEVQAHAERHFRASSGGSGGGGAAMIDLLFINAGYASFAPFTAATEESYDRTFNTNTRGAFFLAQRLTSLIRPGGAIVFTTSVSIGAGYPGMALYSASKAATYSFVQTMAAELARGSPFSSSIGEGIRVNAVSPGFVDTPTMGVAGTSPEQLDQFAAIGAKTTPMGRIATPEEVARAVLFLGFEATFTTGVELLMDGGARFLRPELE